MRASGDNSIVVKQQTFHSRGAGVELQARGIQSKDKGEDESPKEGFREVEKGRVWLRFYKREEKGVAITPVIVRLMMSPQEASKIARQIARFVEKPVEDEKEKNKLLLAFHPEDLTSSSGDKKNGKRLSIETYSMGDEQAWSLMISATSAKLPVFDERKKNYVSTGLINVKMTQDDLLFMADLMKSMAIDMSYVVVQRRDLAKRPPAVAGQHTSLAADPQPHYQDIKFNERKPTMTHSSSTAF